MIGKLERLQIFISMRYLLIIILLLGFNQIQGQIVVDTIKQRLIVRCTESAKYNDSLLTLLSDFPRYKEIIINSDSNDVKIDVSKFEAEIISFHGNGTFDIINNSKEELLNLRKIIVLSKLKGIDFGKGMKSLDTLIIYNSGLEKIPASIKCCTNLRFIDLSFNKIGEIDSQLKRLQKLEYLVMTNNKLSEIPGSISFNKELIGLNFESNQIRKIPIEILHLPNLRVINLMGNNIDEYPSELLQKTGLEVYGIE